MVHPIQVLRGDYRSYWPNSVVPETKVVKNQKDAEELARKGLIDITGSEVEEIEQLEAADVSEKPSVKQAATPKNKMAAEPDNKFD